MPKNMEIAGDTEEQQERKSLQSNEQPRKVPKILVQTPIKFLSDSQKKLSCAQSKEAPSTCIEENKDEFQFKVPKVPTMKKTKQPISTTSSGIPKPYSSTTKGKTVFDVDLEDPFIFQTVMEAYLEESKILAKLNQGVPVKDSTKMVEMPKDALLKCSTKIEEMPSDSNVEGSTKMAEMSPDSLQMTEMSPYSLQLTEMSPDSLQMTEMSQEATGDKEEKREKKSPQYNEQPRTMNKILVQIPLKFLSDEQKKLLCTQIKEAPSTCAEENQDEIEFKVPKVPSMKKTKQPISATFSGIPSNYSSTTRGQTVLNVDLEESQMCAKLDKGASEKDSTKRVEMSQDIPVRGSIKMVKMSSNSYLEGSSKMTGMSPDSPVKGLKQMLAITHYEPEPYSTTLVEIALNKPVENSNIHLQIDQNNSVEDSKALVEISRNKLVEDLNTLVKTNKPMENSNTPVEVAQNMPFEDSNTPIEEARIKPVKDSNTPIEEARIKPVEDSNAPVKSGTY